MSNEIRNADIEPSLLGPPPSPPSLANTPNVSELALNASTTASAARVGQHAECTPARAENGRLVPEVVFAAHLQTLKKKEHLRAACATFNIRYSKKSNLEWLQAALVRYWYPNTSNLQVHGPLCPQPPSIINSQTQLLDSDHPCTDDVEMAVPNPQEREIQLDLDIPDEDLAQQYDVDEGMANSIFGAFDTGGLEDEDEDEEEEEDLFEDLGNDQTFRQYQTNVRVAAAQRTEKNRRAGGRKTQKCIVKSWNIFQQEAQKQGKIRDDIVDEHSLLLYIEFSANRCKRNRRGEYIPGTRIGASQIKKEFFGALRIRKVQDAHDPTLALKRPATTVHVYDAVKTRMDEALRNSREGLIPEEDAPDIVANTWLAQLSDDILVLIRYGFLDHRELKATILGHLSWTLMNASGNRGDDIRALCLCEMQLYFFLHPNNETCIPAVLGLQSDMEQKAKRKAMSTTVNPTYTCFIAHRDPEMCPLGALAFYLHYVHDVAGIDVKYDIDYTVNKSWRAIRLIHGSSATVPYNETALQNLFCQAYKKAGIKHRLKAHLARHMLGYHQEKMGVSTDQTTKLGWSRDVFLNTYAPALPKKAILGAHGYKAHETYSPPWTKVKVPEEFLQLICPMAENNLSLVKGRENLQGATSYWEMVIILRPYLFQAAAAIYQVRLSSSLFRLPALARADVQTWMESTFPQELASIKENTRHEVSLERLQNEIIREAMEQLRNESTLQRESLRGISDAITELNSLLKRRTSQWTPAKAMDYENPYMDTVRPTQGALSSVSRQLDFSFLPSNSTATPGPSTSAGQALSSSADGLAASLCVNADTRESEDSGVYFGPDESLRGFIAPSPRSPNIARPRTEVDLVLPPLLAFCEIGSDLPQHHPFLGKKSVQWASVFASIKQCGLLWDVWRPSRSLDQMSISEVWECYNVGEPVKHDGIQTGINPPLRLVEQHFQSEWRKKDSQRKFWQRFREIPEWIDSQIASGLTAAQAILEADKMREVLGKSVLLGTSALSNLIIARRKQALVDSGTVSAQLNLKMQHPARNEELPQLEAAQSRRNLEKTQIRKYSIVLHLSFLT